MLIGRIDAVSDATYAHQDGLGSIRLITDDSGAVVGTTAYDAFGTQRATTGVQYRLGYTGEQLDAETGFVYLRARYYDPGQGRFLTKDPFPGFRSDPLSLHKYSYVGNSPLNYIDPSGLSAQNMFEASGGSGFAGGAYSGGTGPFISPGAINAAIIITTALIGSVPIAGQIYEGVAGALDGVTSWFAKSGNSLRGIEQAQWDVGTKGLTKDEKGNLHEELQP